MSTVFESLSLKGLRKAHLRQLLMYIDDRDRSSWYCGPQKDFEKRHQDLKKWISDAVDYAYSEGVRFPK